MLLKFPESVNEMIRKPTYSINDLLYLMSRLRDPETGCPWDCKQDFRSLVQYTLEEAYEVADVIERGDRSHLPEELGDLLFQVVFYGQLGSEDEQFDFSTIVDSLVKKLISRHPHVFPDGSLHSYRNKGEAPGESEIISSWESTKHNERKVKGYSRLLEDIPVSFPALVRAEKIQKRASKVGFDWPDLQGVLNKISEEIQELSAEIDRGEMPAMEDELGDILFSVVNLARHIGCDAEKSLRRATHKFETRFGLMEDFAYRQGRSLDDLTLHELDDLWGKAKVVSE